MKPRDIFVGWICRLAIIILPLVLVYLIQTPRGVYAQSESDTPTPIFTMTVSPIPSLVSTFTPVVTSYGRPMMVLISYSTSPQVIEPDEEFVLTMVVKNLGTTTGKFIQAAFQGEEILPLENGGIYSIGDLAINTSYRLDQTFVLKAGSSTGTKIVPVTLSYVDPNGDPYTDKFNIVITTGGSPVSNYVPSTATPTGLPGSGPQVAIRGFSAEPSMIEPGSMFNLKIQIENIGEKEAHKISMIFGGGTLNEMGINGGSGELSTFGLMNSSNLVSLGSLKAGEIREINKMVFVNNVTQAGAYNLRLSFIYYDDKGEKILDDQIISLLVVTKPRLTVDFYSVVNANLGDAVSIPLRINNTRSTPVYLQKIIVTSAGWTFTPQVLVENVGKIEGEDNWLAENLSGVPSQTGLTDINVQVYYYDDFNHIQSIDYTVNLYVQPAIPITLPTGTPDSSGFSPVDPSSQQETTTPQLENPVDKTSTNLFTRFLLGLFGLDSSGGLPYYTFRINYP